MNDLRSVSAKYHRSCYADILKQDNTPEETIDPRTINTNNAMDQIIDYIDDHPDCQFSSNELMNVVTDNWPRAIFHKDSAGSFFYIIDDGMLLHRLK